jgi:hypothetical protein
MMQVWLLRGSETEPCPLHNILIQGGKWAETDRWTVEHRRFSETLAEEVRSRPPLVLVWNTREVPPGPWVEQCLEAGAALVAITSLEEASELACLGERYPIHLLHHSVGWEGLVLAIRGAMASLRWTKRWQDIVRHLQSRLEDRILVEKAKGVLVRTQIIGEEDAYKRLRVLARQKRRPLREIAQALLDTQVLWKPSDARGTRAENDSTASAAGEPSASPGGNATGSPRFDPT